MEMDEQTVVAQGMLCADQERNVESLKYWRWSLSFVDLFAVGRAVSWAQQLSLFSSLPTPQSQRRSRTLSVPI